MSAPSPNQNNNNGNDGNDGSSGLSQEELLVHQLIGRRMQLINAMQAHHPHLARPFGQGGGQVGAALSNPTPPTALPGAIPSIRDALNRHYAHFHEQQLSMMNSAILSHNQIGPGLPNTISQQAAEILRQSLLRAQAQQEAPSAQLKGKSAGMSYHALARAHSQAPVTHRNNEPDQILGSSLQTALKKKITQKIQEKLKTLKPEITALEQARAVELLLREQRPQMAGLQQSISKWPLQGMQPSYKRDAASPPMQKNNDSNSKTNSLKYPEALACGNAATESEADSGLAKAALPIVAVKEGISMKNEEIGSKRGVLSISESEKASAVTDRTMAEARAKAKAMLESRTKAKTSAPSYMDLVGQESSASPGAEQTTTKKRKKPLPKEEVLDTQAILSKLDKMADSLEDKNVRSTIKEDRDHSQERWKEMWDDYEKDMKLMQSRLSSYLKLEELAGKIAGGQTTGNNRAIVHDNLTITENSDCTLEMTHLALKNYQMLEDSMDWHILRITPGKIMK